VTYYTCSAISHGNFILHFYLNPVYALLKLNIQDVPVLSTSVRIVDSARDLKVVIDSGLTICDHVTASVVRPTTSCVGYERLRIHCQTMPRRH